MTRVRILAHLRVVRGMSTTAAEAYFSAHVHTWQVYRDNRSLDLMYLYPIPL